MMNSMRCYLGGRASINIQSGNEFQKILWSSKRFHQVPKGSTKFHKVLPSSRRFHGVPKGSTNWPQAKRIQPYKASAPYTDVLADGSAAAATMIWIGV